MKHVRILHMIGSLNIGGSQTAIINLINYINCDLVKFDFIIDSPDELYFAPMLQEKGCKIYVFPKFTGRNYRELKAKWNTFFNEHPEYKILHSHVRSYASLYLPIAKRHGVRTIIHSHSTSNGSGIKSVAKKILQYPLRFQADRFIGCSETSGKWLFGKRIVNSEKYHTLQNAIDIDKFKFNETVRNKYRAELNLEGRVYAHVGRLHPAKNHRFLLDIFKKVHEIDSTSVLLLIGDGDLRQDIEKRILELGLGESVKMLGNRSDVDKLLSASDVFLFPSEWEGVPLTVVEAQANGLPCLVSNRVTADVCVSELVTRLPIDVGVDSWIKCIMELDTARKDVSEKIAIAGYDVRKNARWLEKYYLELIE